MDRIAGNGRHAGNRHRITLKTGTRSRCKPAADGGRWFREHLDVALRGVSHRLRRSHKLVRHRSRRSAVVRVVSERLDGVGNEAMKSCLR